MRSFLLLLGLGLTAALECTVPEELSCQDNSKCIPSRYLCDGDNDCTDGSDEDVQLCTAWKNPNCERGSVQCTVNEVTTCVKIDDYCQRDKPKCQGDLDRRICKILEDKKLSPISSIPIPRENDPGTAYNASIVLGSELEGNINNTLSHPSCPPLSTRVGGQCLSVFFVGSSSWGEARAFCKHLGGDLLTIQNVTHYTDIVNHMVKNQITSDFWLGGRYEFDDLSWVWLDGTPMTLGTPFWTLRRYDFCDTRNVTVPGSAPRTANNAECYHYRQAPENPPRGFCASITYDKHFYMSDEDCLSKKAPLCAL